MDIAGHLVQAQDDSDTVVLPNACKGQLIQLADNKKVRCFSVLVRVPHVVPEESWSMVTVLTMPGIDQVDDLLRDHIMVDHVTRGFIGDNAIQLIFSKEGGLDAIRLLPPGDGPAQQQWEAQANKMIGK